MEGGQGVCGRGGGCGGLIYWKDMAYHCHPLLRGVLQRCWCCCSPSNSSAVRCLLILLGSLSLLLSLRRGTGTLCLRGRRTGRPGCGSCTLVSAPWAGEDAANSSRATRGRGARSSKYGGYGLTNTHLTYPTMQISKLGSGPQPKLSSPQYASEFYSCPQHSAALNILIEKFRPTV
eukprot:COSAG01_NODE_289_length_19391_cov_119.323122_12_plen_176_part_00